VSYHAVTNSPCQYFPPLPTCCRCVCDLTGLARERGDRVDTTFAKPVLVAGRFAMAFLLGIWSM